MVEKANYDTKIEVIEKKILDHGKYINTQTFNKLTAEDFAARLSHAKLATKNDIAYFIDIFWW